jgi:signal transduction histidine kinase
MFTSPSQEFLILCQNQLALLNQTCGAALSIVYLTEDFSGKQLVPVAVCPDPKEGWQPEMYKQDDASPSRQLVPVPRLSGFLSQFPEPLLLEDTTYESTWQDEQGTWQRQLVVPLVYEGLAMGLLVTGRSDRPWRAKELGVVEKFADSLAIARLLDQRSYWLNQQLKQQRVLAADHRDHLNNLLHQIRNPLTAIKTFGKLLLKKLLPSNPHRSLIVGLVQESDRLQSLLVQLDREIEVEHQSLQERLTPALLPAPSFKESPDPPESQESLSSNPSPDPPTEASQILEPLVLSTIDLDQVLAPLLISAEAIAQDRNLKFFTELPKKFPPLTADAAALREVLSNLLDNALKYTPTGGSIFLKTLDYSQSTDLVDSVASNNSDSSNNSPSQNIPDQNISSLPPLPSLPPLSPPLPSPLCLAITNTGSKIPAADLPKLFERHYRGVQKSGEITGTGLGLAIAQQLLEQMEGKITVSSPADPYWAMIKGADQPEINSTTLTTFFVWLKVS